MTPRFFGCSASVTPRVNRSLPWPGGLVQVQRVGGFVAREPKVSEEGLERLRDLFDEGWALKDLAAEFGITRQHAGRLVRGLQRQQIGPLDAETVRTGVLPAVERHLAEVRVDPAGEVLAATARALASKMDSCSVSDATGAAAAMPRLAAQLGEVLRQLQEGAPSEPSALDQLVVRRDARRLANAIQAGS